MRSSCVRVDLAGDQDFRRQDMASEDAGVKRGAADAVGQFGRVIGVPEAQVGAVPGDAAAVGKAKRAGGVGGDAQQRLFRRHAEQGAGHVHRQRQRGQRRGAGVQVGRHRHRHAGGAKAAIGGAWVSRRV
jgi:hypothetical protein